MRPVVALLPLAVASTVVAQEAPRYSVAGLRCAVFGIEARADIRSQRGRAVIQDRAGRDGVLVVRARDTTDGLSITAWFDSLAVWRETADGIDRGDTEGFLGGRYRGVLLSDGGYRSIAVPFIPDQLADFADLRIALDDFFPRLPGRSLDRGDRWREGDSLDVTRVADRDGFAQYRWSRTSQSRDSVAAEAGVARLDQRAAETGQLSWSPEYGLAGWYRRIEVTARLPRTASVSQGMTSSVRQEIWVTRRPEHPACADG